MKVKRLLVILLVLPLIAAKSATKTKAVDKKGDEALNFEATVIEGERKNPSIFLDITIDRFSDLDSILLIRKHFNNFHLVDDDRRPLFIY